MPSDLTPKPEFRNKPQASDHQPDGWNGLGRWDDIFAVLWRSQTCAVSASPGASRMVHPVTSKEMGTGIMVATVSSSRRLYTQAILSFSDLKIYLYIIYTEGIFTLLLIILSGNWVVFLVCIPLPLFLPVALKPAGQFQPILQQGRDFGGNNVSWQILGCVNRRMFFPLDNSTAASF